MATTKFRRENSRYFKERYISFTTVSAAREFFRAENGETYPFVCWSWLLFPDNKQLFSEKSNTYRFLSEYDIIDVDYDNGENLWRLFDTEERNPDRLPTDTRVRRNYVAYLKSGKRVGWGLGIKL